MRLNPSAPAWIVALLAASCQTGLAGEADFFGAWTIVSVAPSPWGAPLGDFDAYVGTRITFLPSAVEGKHPFGCGKASYAVADLPPQELFQGALDPNEAAVDAQRLAIPTPATTLMVSCDTGSFDFHRTENGLVTALDNAIVGLKRDARQ